MMASKASHSLDCIETHPVAEAVEVVKAFSSASSFLASDVVLEEVVVASAVVVVAGCRMELVE